MDCEEFYKNLHLYLERRISEIGNLLEFEYHAATCEKCSDEFADIYLLHNQLRETKDRVIKNNPMIGEMLTNLDELRRKGIKGKKYLKFFEKEFSAAISKFAPDQRHQKKKEPDRSKRAGGEISDMAEKELKKQSVSVLFKEKIKSSIEVLKKLRSETSISCTLYNFDKVKGSGTEINEYMIGDPIMLVITTPKGRVGYLIVYHYDEEDNLTMIFPKSNTDENFISVGEQKIIEIQANPPKGKHYLKTLLIKRQIIKPEEINFSDISNVTSAIESSIKNISRSKKKEWIESVTEFIVI